jgi:hypothetical protein
MEGFIIAREKGFSQQNILGSWNGAGLVPWNPRKIMRKVGAEFTPPPPPSPIMATPSPRSFLKDVLMSPVNADNIKRAGKMVTDELEQKGHVNTPMRKFIIDLTVRMEKIDARNAILAAEKANAEAVLGARKKRESGIRGLFKGVHSIASEEFLRKVRDHENRIRTRKNKGGKNASKQSESQASIHTVDGEGNMQYDSDVETDSN